MSHVEGACARGPAGTGPAHDAGLRGRDGRECSRTRRGWRHVQLLRRVLTGLMAQALLDPEFAQAFRERFLFSRRAALRQILDRAAARGEIPADVDRELLIDMVYGLLWYRLMLDHAPLGEPVGRQLTGLLLRAVSAPAPGTGAASTPSHPKS
ncbi:TetR/AcrR family transcriptional regulator C-terminal ligand-binding domain-containing protein [Nonomuraea sp. SMC257]|uniref:TetR/AcrR family transcriptional regulator C-terminal ligand-binding domain-containing protein n=1 Tax=Nonomuraea montanisoli TaxID=2741721 RepID=A0A7Y6I9P1_9ACTN|nr:TetR/AcrR family transcriptional regulator C-terminal ligand-binding domain-containing protein [Nonomuraea montanisoli]